MKILAVTGCPTGIAHTYMAQEALEDAAKKLNCSIKVETNGAVGVENELTVQEIEEADAIIVASDKNVPMDRFNGKPVIEVSVTEGINHAEQLLQRAINGKAPIRGGVAPIGERVDKPSMGHEIYKHLMNGVSHMLPLVVAGGVLIAISFLWGIFSFDPDHEQYNVIAATIKSVGDVSMGLMVPVLAAFIAQSISGRPGMLAGLVAGMFASATGSGFLGGILGGFFIGYFVLYLVKAMSGMPRSLEGLKSIFILPIISVFAAGIFMILIGGPVAALNTMMMNFLESLQSTNPFILGIVVGCMSAFDMGGPVNKAAYVTGTMLLGQGNYFFMAGVSAACITPPLVIAIAATLFKNRFTPEDRTAGFVNYILGSTHITEGAIPFAANNPLKVIPVLMIASSISAILTYMMKIEVPAPHGGFLILGLVNKPLLWVFCILVGSTIGAVLYAAVTPKVTPLTTIGGTDPLDTFTRVEEYEPTIAQKMTPLYEEETIKMELHGKNKTEVIAEMADVLAEANKISNKEVFITEIFERENQTSTGLGNGVAIPHAKSSVVNEPSIAIGISREGFDFEAHDDEKCHLVFMIAAKDDDDNIHLENLATLSKKLIHQEIIDALKNAQNAQEVLSILGE